MKFIIYTADSCRWGDEARSLLSRLGYEFEVRDIQKDPKHAEFFREMGFMTIPQIYVTSDEAGKGGLVGGYYDLRAWINANT